METSDKLVLSAISLLVLAVIGATAWHFLYKEDFHFLVEAPCQPGASTCFYRDCSNPDDCPPNGYEQYRVFTMTSQEFDACGDNSCLVECLTGAIECAETMCGEAEGDECVSFTDENTE